MGQNYSNGQRRGRSVDSASRKPQRQLSIFDLHPEGAAPNASHSPSFRFQPSPRNINAIKTNPTNSGLVNLNPINTSPISSIPINANSINVSPLNLNPVVTSPPYQNPKIMARGNTKPNLLNILSQEPLTQDNYAGRNIRNKSEERPGLGLAEYQVEERLSVRENKGINEAIQFTELFLLVKGEDNNTLQIKGGPLLAFNLASISENLTLNENTVAGRMSFSKEANAFSQRFRNMVGGYDIVTENIALDDIVSQSRFKSDRKQAILELHKESRELGNRRRNSKNNEIPIDMTSQVVNQDSVGRKFSEEESQLIRKLIGQPLQRDSMGSNSGRLSHSQKSQEDSLEERQYRINERTVANRKGSGNEIRQPRGEATAVDRKRSLDEYRKTNISPIESRDIKTQRQPIRAVSPDAPGTRSTTTKTNNYAFQFAPDPSEAQIRSANITTRNQQSSQKVQKVVTAVQFTNKTGPKYFGYSKILNQALQKEEEAQRSPRQSPIASKTSINKDNKNIMIISSPLEKEPGRLGQQGSYNQANKERKESGNAYKDPQSINIKKTVTKKFEKEERPAWQGNASTRDKSPVMNKKMTQNAQPPKDSTKIGQNNKLETKGKVDSASNILIGKQPMGEIKVIYDQRQQGIKDMSRAPGGQINKGREEKSPNDALAKFTANKIPTKQFDLTVPRYEKGDSYFTEGEKRYNNKDQIAPHYNEILKLPTDSERATYHDEFSENQIPVRSDLEADESFDSDDDIEPIEATLDLSSYLNASKGGLNQNNTNKDSTSKSNKTPLQGIHDRGYIKDYTPPVQPKQDNSRRGMEREELNYREEKNLMYVNYNSKAQPFKQENSREGYDVSESSREYQGYTRGNINNMQKGKDKGDPFRNFDYQGRDEEFEREDREDREFLDDVKEKLEKLSSKIDNSLNRRPEANYTRDQYTPRTDQVVQYGKVIDTAKERYTGQNLGYNPEDLFENRPETMTDLKHYGKMANTNNQAQSPGYSKREVSPPPNYKLIAGKDLQKDKYKINVAPAPTWKK